MDLLSVLLPPLFWFSPCDFLHLSAAVSVSPCAPSLPYGLPCMPLQLHFPQSQLCLDSSMALGPSVASSSPNSSHMGRAHFHLASLPLQPAFPLFSYIYSLCSDPVHLEDEAWGCPLLCNPPLLCTIHLLSRWGMCPLKDSGRVVTSSSCRASLAELDFCSALYYCDLRPVTGDNSRTYLVGLL